MDKNAIKKYAVWARHELIEKVTQKAQQFGVEDGKEMDINADSVNGFLLIDVQKKQRQALIQKVKQDGFQQVMEEVAYTWFNRFIALRFMEVNGYLPSHVRVFTDDNNAFKPQILSEALHLDLAGLDMDKVYAMKEANQDEELFKYLLIVQCNDLNSILPGMFQKIADYTELLLPDYLLREGSVIEQMISMIPQEDWTDQVQIIGWLYQYYNTEPKDQVFADLKKNKKITKEKIPAATQLFTPDWIVRYMVENSLGRLWLEGHPDNKDKFLPTNDEQDRYIQTHEDDGKWHYYLDEAEQEPDVQKQLDEIHREYSALKPEDIRCIDPCMGSGHILCYLFDALVKIYEDYGYSARDAASSIVKNNLWGLDIDERAAQLAYFAVMMKARQYDRRFFARGIQPHVYAFRESNKIDPQIIKAFVAEDADRKVEIDSIIDDFRDARDYGSIINVRNVHFESLYQRINDIQNNAEADIFERQAAEIFLPIIMLAQVLSQKYHVVVTNPPYMGIRNMSGKLAEYLKENYSDAKFDLSTACMEKANELCRADGFFAMINIPVWMFLSSYDQLRGNIIRKHTLVNMLHLGRGVFGSDFGTTSFVISKCHVKNYVGTYRKLFDKQGAVDSLETKENVFLTGKGIYETSQQSFTLIPGEPIAYWVKNEELFEKGTRLERVANPRQGLKTLDNERFLRNWYEVSFQNIGFGMHDRTEAEESGCRWFPINHGGPYRKYYGNNYAVVNWQNDGAEMKELAISKYHSVTRTITNLSSYFKPGITWTVISSASTSFRRYGYGFMFSNSGQCIVPETSENLDYLTGFLNSKVVQYILSILSPTLGFESGYIKKIPIRIDAALKHQVEDLTKEASNLSKEDWDSFETSWDFKEHPFIKYHCKKIEEAFESWKEESNSRCLRMKEIQKKLNEIFIDIYGLNGELTAEVSDSDITLNLADKERDIKSFISYAVGCMFGRYSIDLRGLAFAGGQWKDSDYHTFLPDKDNIIPICDDEYFDDDIVGKFIGFVKCVFGNETVGENLRYIADCLGGKGSPKDIIREYFLNDFFKDHCSIYSFASSGKRPIYWLFDSGKKNGFKCLIYMHRYQPDTIARIRTDYVHEQQSRYRTAIEETEQRLLSADGSNRVKLNKKLKHLQEQDEEIHAYEEKIHHLADQMISIDLDDGVKHNYAIFQDVLAKIK